MENSEITETAALDVSGCLSSLKCSFEILNTKAEKCPVFSLKIDYAISRAFVYPLGSNEMTFESFQKLVCAYLKKSGLWEKINYLADCSIVLNPVIIIRPTLSLRENDNDARKNMRITLTQLFGMFVGSTGRIKLHRGPFFSFKDSQPVE